MLAFYVLFLVVVAVTAIKLWRQDRYRTRLAYGLYGALAVESLAGLYVLLAAEPFELGVAFGHLLAWGFLLWGLALMWQYVVLALFVGVAWVFLPALPAAALGWGLITAVPFAALLQQRQRFKVPIIAPKTPVRRSGHDVLVEGDLSPESIKSEKPVLECLTDGILITDREGLTVYVNQAMAAIIGEVPDGLVGRPVTEVLAHLPMLDAENSMHQLNLFEMNGRVIRGRMSIIYDSESAVEGTVAILRDVTTEHRAAQARDNFLTTISHELRTPLTAIKGYAEMIGNGAGGQLTESQRMFMETIQRNVNHMVQLINSLIFASTIKGGRLEYGAGTTDLARLIDQIVREMRTRARVSQQQIHVDLDEERLQPIDADPTHIATVLEELIVNALKFNRPGGKVRVTATMEYDQNNQQQFAVVSISDDGIGIDPEDQAHVFNEFYRPERSEAQVRSGGIGMGLSIVRALIEAYNGRIWFESTPEVGTTFTFILPKERPLHLSLDTAPSTDTSVV